MIEIASPLQAQSLTVKRRMGQYSQGRPGPLLIVVAGLHGNEPSGVIAFDRLLAALREAEYPFFGQLLGIAGNLPALAVGRRFIDEDLNRIWQRERVESLHAGRQPTTSEEAELLAIHDLIDEYRHRPGENYFLDCHTTSSETVPYISVPHHDGSVELAGEFPVYTVVGGGDVLGGVFDRYWIDRGFRGFTFEAGRHNRLCSIEAQEAAMWLMLRRIGCLADGGREAEPYLARTQLDGPRFFRIVHVHKVTPERGFRMRPGFFNFQRVRQGDLLAWEHDSPVLAPQDGRIFLPLYQPQGDDGFTIVQSPPG